MLPMVLPDCRALFFPFDHTRAVSWYPSLPSLSLGSSLGGEEGEDGLALAGPRIEAVLAAPSSHEGTETPVLGQINELMHGKCSRTAGPIVNALKKAALYFMCRTCKSTGSISLKSSLDLSSPCGQGTLSWLRGLVLPRGTQGQSRALELMLGSDFHSARFLVCEKPSLKSRASSEADCGLRCVYSLNFLLTFRCWCMALAWPFSSLIPFSSPQL